jgi:hypothetical protein
MYAEALGHDSTELVSFKEFKVKKGVDGALFGDKGGWGFVGYGWMGLCWRQGWMGLCWRQGWMGLRRVWLDGAMLETRVDGGLRRVWLDGAMLETRVDGPLFDTREWVGLCW